MACRLTLGHGPTPIDIERNLLQTSADLHHAHGSRECAARRSRCPHRRSARSRCTTDKSASRSSVVADQLLVRLAGVSGPAARRARLDGRLHPWSARGRNRFRNRLRGRTAYRPLQSAEVRRRRQRVSASASAAAGVRDLEVSPTMRRGKPGNRGRTRYTGPMAACAQSPGRAPAAPRGGPCRSTYGLRPATVTDEPVGVSGTDGFRSSDQPLVVLEALRSNLSKGLRRRVNATATRMSASACLEFGGSESGR
jgi:hypothetical protein